MFPGANFFTSANNTFTGTFTGNGSGLTGLNASQLSAGTMPDARLSTNVALVNADSYLFVPGCAFLTYTAAGLNMFPRDNGSMDISFPGAPGARTIHAAITLPGVLFGRVVTIKEATIYYQWSNGTNSFIDSTRLNRQLQGNVSGNVLVGFDDTRRDRDVFTTYSLAMTTNNVFSSDQAFVGVRMQLSFANTTQFLRLGGVRFRLGHQ